MCLYEAIVQEGLQLSYASPEVALRRPLGEIVETTLAAAGRSQHTRRSYQMAIAYFVYFLDDQRVDVHVVRVDLLRLRPDHPDEAAWAGCDVRQRLADRGVRELVQPVRRQIVEPEIVRRADRRATLKGDEVAGNVRVALGAGESEHGLDVCTRFVLHRPADVAVSASGRAVYRDRAVGVRQRFAALSAGHLLGSAPVARCLLRAPHIAREHIRALSPDNRVPVWADRWSLVGNHVICQLI